MFCVSLRIAGLRPCMSMTALLGVRHMNGLSGNSESFVESNSAVTPHWSCTQHHVSYHVFRVSLQNAQNSGKFGAKCGMVVIRVVCVKPASGTDPLRILRAPKTPHLCQHSRAVFINCMLLFCCWARPKALATGLSCRSIDLKSTLNELKSIQ